MSVFTEAEYRDSDQRPSLEEAWGRLPVLCHIDGLAIRWVGPLVNLGLDPWLADMAEGAWGPLEDCGWQEILEDCGEALAADGSFRPAWAQAFGEAARTLAEAGEYAGPESDPEAWAAWLCFELAKPREAIERLADEQGALR
ncbi:MAG: hypothetical protein ABIO70_35835 [Pseudomonadota bacterium]